MAKIQVVKDLPHNIPESEAVAIDTEAMGLCLWRDRLCVVQVCFEPRGTCYLVQIDRDNPEAPFLKSLLTNPGVTKIFHYGRFDIAGLYRTLGVICQPVYCTKIASRLARTYSDYHGLRELCRELLGVDLNKAEQSSDWGASVLTDSQKAYAARDVLYLHELRNQLQTMLVREGWNEMAKACFEFLPHRAILDAHGFDDDIFAHKKPPRH